MNELLMAAARLLSAQSDPASIEAGALLSALAHLPSADAVDVARQCRALALGHGDDAAVSDLDDLDDLDDEDDEDDDEEQSSSAVTGLSDLGSLDEADPADADPAADTPAGPAVAGLADLGSLDDDFASIVEGLGALDVPDEDAGLNADAAAVARPVDLIAHVEAVDAAAALSAVTAVIPSLAAAAGAFDVGIPVATGDGFEVPLTAVGDSEEWLAPLTPGTVMFDGLVPTQAGARVRITVAGDFDPQNPPMDIAAAVNDAVATIDEEELPMPTALTLRMARLDGQPMSEEDLDDPLRVAMGNLAHRLGALHVIGTAVGDTPAERLVSIGLAGGGDIDPRGIALGMVGFGGVLEFPGVGKVELKVHDMA